MLEEVPAELKATRVPATAVAEAGVKAVGEPP